MTSSQNPHQATRQYSATNAIARPPVKRHASHGTDITTPLASTQHDYFPPSFAFHSESIAHCSTPALSKDPMFALQMRAYDAANEFYMHPRDAINASPRPSHQAGRHTPQSNPETVFMWPQSVSQTLPDPRTSVHNRIHSQPLAKCVPFDDSGYDISGSMPEDPAFYSRSRSLHASHALSSGNISASNHTRSVTSPLLPYRDVSRQASAISSSGEFPPANVRTAGCSIVLQSSIAHQTPL